MLEDDDGVADDDVYAELMQILDRSRPTSVDIERYLALAFPHLSAVQVDDLVNLVNLCWPTNETLEPFEFGNKIYLDRFSR